jgi:hypothetical protein
MSDGLASVEPDGPLYRLGSNAIRGRGRTGRTPARTRPSVTGTTTPRRAIASSTHHRNESVPSSRPSLASGRISRCSQSSSGSRATTSRLPPSREPGRTTACSAKRPSRGRFVDVGDTKSLATLRTALAASAIRYGLDEVDAATIRLRAPRAFTQEVSRFVYEQGPFAGIRYRSRLGDDVLNWAIFEPAPDAPSALVETTPTAITADDADLRAALGLLGLALA